MVNCFNCYFQDNRRNNISFIKMNVLVGLLASLAVVQAAPHIGHYTYPAATTLVRVPHEDSAIVHSSRFGPNFSYSIAQQHAYQLVPPNVAIYNQHPFIYSHQNPNAGWNTVASGPPFYIHHPVVPNYVPVLYPNPNEQPTEYPDVEQTEPNADSEPTENPDAETVEVDNVDIDGDIDATTEQSTQQNDNENDTYDDTVLVESYRFGSGDNRK